MGRTRCLYVAAWMALAAGCTTDGTPRDATVEVTAPSLADFGDGSWVLRADREWDRDGQDVQFPSDPLDETGYVPLDDVIVHAVEVSNTGTHLAISMTGDETVTGDVLASTEDRIAFDLSGGLFAGGRFQVWADDQGLQAEFTVYGSGVPIISSVRGAFEPATAGDAS